MVILAPLKVAAEVVRGSHSEAPVPPNRPRHSPPQGERPRKPPSPPRRTNRSAPWTLGSSLTRRRTGAS